MKEKNYIRYRKLKAFGNRLCFYVCRIFPIQKNLITVCTFEGKGGFGCNPKYIVQELHKQHPEYKVVWLVNPDVIEEKEFPDYIKRVPNTLWGRAYWLTRSKVWIDNYRKPYGTVKRKGQYYINTWHANMGFKTIGLWRGKAFSKMAYLVSKNDSDMIDCVVIDSDYCQIMFRKGLLFEGEYLKVGQPRCDILCGNREKEKASFREKYHLPMDAKIVMYAPTFREGAKDGKRRVFSAEYTLDFDRLLDNLTKRFGGDWYLCIRVHPQLAHSVDEGKEKLKKTVNASGEDDMYEVLAAMDAYITDYSSAAFDAGYTNMPVFIYADDYEQYIQDRGSMLWMYDSASLNIVNDKRITPEIDTVLPFTMAQDNDTLESNIINFDNEVYVRKMNQMKTDTGLIFDGFASDGVVKQIEHVIGEL